MSEREREGESRRGRERERFVHSDEGNPECVGIIMYKILIDSNCCKDRYIERFDHLDQGILARDVIIITCARY